MWIINSSQCTTLHHEILKISSLYQRNPVYIGGPHGALERCTTRHYFAIRSFMDMLLYPEESRFSVRMSNWYDLASRYRKQLVNLGKQGLPHI